MHKRSKKNSTFYLSTPPGKGRGSWCQTFIIWGLWGRKGPCRRDTRVCVRERERERERRDSAWSFSVASHSPEEQLPLSQEAATHHFPLRLAAGQTTGGDPGGRDWEHHTLTWLHWHIHYLHKLCCQRNP